MRYFVGHLIRGEAAEYYKTTCRELCEQFKVEDVSNIVPPHITVKTAFERQNIDTVDDALSFLTEANPIPLELSGWNHFTNKTIFLDAPKPPQELKEYIKSVLSKLHSIGLPSSLQENDTHIHMSVARFLKPLEFEKVWAHLQGSPSPQFDIKFDNLTIFYKEKREDKAWKILKTFPLLGKR